MKSYYSLPNIRDLLARLQKCMIFSSLDLRLGYHQIGLTLEAKPKTTFAPTSSKWHWNVTLSCICLLSGVFFYLMSQVLSGLDFCFAFLDGILAYSSSWKEHLQHLEVVFKCLKEANLKCELNKCQFLKGSSLLGSPHIQTRVLTTTGKNISNRKLQEPSNIDELQHFLGFTGYYRKFIP